MTIEKIGRRYYLTGNTYAVRDALKAAGCHWDAERKAWWTSKQDVAERFGGQDAAPAPAKPSKDDLAERRCYGKVEYKGRTYYVIGVSERTGKLWLTVLDCSIDFWAPEGLCRWVKRYEVREHTYRGHTSRSYQTLERIREFIESEKRNKAAGMPVCAECGRSGELVQDLEDGMLKHRHCCDIEPR